MTSDRPPPEGKAPPKPSGEKPPIDRAAEREAKLARALRANLRRRKAEPAKRDDRDPGDDPGDDRARE